jgi:hypothetical protein
MNPYHVKSSITALIFNGKPFAILRKWHILIDTKRMLITVKRRNWHFISFDEETYAFKSVRNVKVDTHLFGADLSIKVYAGEAKVLYISKRKAKKIRNLLLSNDWNKKDADIIIDL